MRCLRRQCLCSLIYKLKGAEVGHDEGRTAVHRTPDNKDIFISTRQLECKFSKTVTLKLMDVARV
jgi:hypothetical protein